MTEQVTTDDSSIDSAASALSARFGVWIPVEDGLPESGKPVLAAVGKKVLRAAHAAKFALSEEDWGWWNDGEGADYNEANDTTYWPEGWYEWNEYEETHWAVSDHPVTHWMQMPETPNVAIEWPEQAQLANGPARMEGSTT